MQITLSMWAPGQALGGGEIVARGTLDEIINNPISTTGRYLSHALEIEIPGRRRDVNLNKRKKTHPVIEIQGARANNLKSINVKIPLKTLETTYKEKSIADVLEMHVEEACRFFKNVPSIERILSTLKDVGLGYITLGQSGGESQRVKLATELSRHASGKTLYILDEPTTGLHFADIHQRLKILHWLVDLGNTVLIIEHNLEVIKTADYLIDLGPEGGANGGEVVATGTPEEVAAIERSYTGQFLKSVLSGEGIQKS